MGKVSQSMHRRVAALVLMALAGCTTPPATTEPKQPLQVKVLYPLSDTSIPMGQSLKVIIEIREPDGSPAAGAQIELTVRDATGGAVQITSTQAGADGLYRSEAMPIPHRSIPGTWTLTATASLPGAEGRDESHFEVKNSISEDLLQKYGFWVDDPSLGYMETSIGRERGDADNGDLFWSGFYIQMHVLKESHLEVYWRQGDFHLNSSEAVRDFLLDDVGDLGFIPLRELGEFKPVRFKNWEAWEGPARGRLSQYDTRFMVFYAPEVDKTYAISTMVVQPPEGIDAHSVLRDGFELHPELAAHGQAPDPLPRRLPTPRLLSPALGTRFMGAGSPIVLTWQPVKELAADEYYKVKIDFDYSETNTSLYYATRTTQFTLPAELYSIPNCGVFNWQVTLMRGAGIGKDGQPTGEALSYDSLHWYVEWLYPLTEKMPFTPHCQNPQT
jgi:hypothetical protein